MADDLARKLAIEQRKRLTAAIMEHLEAAAYPHLDQPQRTEMRTKVLDSIGRYHDFVLDVIKVGRSDAIRNDESLRLLRTIHNDLRRAANSGDG